MMAPFPQYSTTLLAIPSHRVYIKVLINIFKKNNVVKIKTTDSSRRLLFAYTLFHLINSVLIRINMILYVI